MFWTFKLSFNKDILTFLVWLLFWLLFCNIWAIFFQLFWSPCFNFRCGHLHAAHLWCYPVKLSNFKLKTRPKQLSGYLLYDIALPSLGHLGWHETNRNDLICVAKASTWTNVSCQDKCWAEFSTLEVAACMPCTYCTVQQYDLT